uniref:Uncharacterized protein n=1 Tax=Anguilla anguilla TaxID=7936 RepID=A0A0E9PRX5_ANGAN
MLEAFSKNRVVTPMVAIIPSFSPSPARPTTP